MNATVTGNGSATRGKRSRRTSLGMKGPDEVTTTTPNSLSVVRRTVVTSSVPSCPIGYTLVRLLDGVERVRGFLW